MSATRIASLKRRFKNKICPAAQANYIGLKSADLNLNAAFYFCRKL
ncbi:hypothetical protein CAMRE0001_1780 [Campylobacter rectus RM3267]|uniref:Uncharacterized protein n=1 Tax=Campylobacter rectus RM3267 TaxID=553218 RepID=B9CYG0_CAMRE|nr:hypothetical protein CAMRE0001_1780 [Campylobacter rectus RM3267]